MIDWGCCTLTLDGYSLQFRNSRSADAAPGRLSRVRAQALPANLVLPRPPEVNPPATFPSVCGNDRELCKRCNRPRGPTCSRAPMGWKSGMTARTTGNRSPRVWRCGTQATDSQHHPGQMRNHLRRAGRRETTARKRTIKFALSEDGVCGDPRTCGGGGRDD